jgi:hypothetical protein
VPRVPEVPHVPGLRAFAFAARWFDPATVSRVFEPLVADWQREWIDTPRRRRPIVHAKGMLSFCIAAIVSTPAILRESTPSIVMKRVWIRVARFSLIATCIMVLPFSLQMEASWLRGALWLLLIPSSLALAFPFAMIAAVDAIRRDHALRPNVERAAN